MASETVDVDHPRERPKFGENIKVYTRKNRKKTPNSKSIAENVAISAAADTYASKEIGNKDTGDVAVITSLATIVNHSSEKEINKESDTVSQKSPQILVTEEAPPVSNGVSIQVTDPNGYVRANGDQANPIVTKVNDRVLINVKTGRPNNEIRELKRKFSNELDQIRNVVKRLEDEEVSLSGRSTASGTGGPLQYSMNDERALMRVFSDVGSVAQKALRPFRPLNVSIMENRPGFDDVAEKEKRTPKWKPHGGKKHTRVGADKYINKSFKGCVDLLARMMKHKHGWVFNKPVDVEALNLHDYHVIIKDPMDLGTIKSKLSKYLYTSPKEFAEDVKLTFSNAMTYNPKGHEVHGMAEELLKIFEAKWPAIEADYNLALRYEMVQDMSLRTPTSKSYDVGLPTPTSRLHDMSLATPTSRVSGFRNLVLKKPKAKDLHKRDMTYEEKQKLSANLQSLPPEKLNDIVQIIKKRDSALSQHDDEIEVDIDSVGAETLWELDRFVLNFKKNASKKKRRAEIALKARSGVTLPALTIGPASTMGKSQEDFQIGEKSNANPSSDHGEHEGDGAGKSSGSSSSSSGSGSSSSDSDSDSSSSNGSEKGGSPKT